ncbi:MAG: N-acetyltransferase [Deltaproteobacteria bacterium]|nr:N-acetyltransferase [Deltaproteobacteria bacterium]
MNMSIRLETPDDFRETEILTRDAFWDVYKPGCDEHLIIHKMRHIPAFVNELDFVAVYDNRIIGNIVFTRAKIVHESNAEYEVLCMGPISVSPLDQRRGVGSKLITHSFGCAARMGFRAIIIFGNPNYYHRFGFVTAQGYNIKTSEGENFDAFMALELYENSLKGIEGRFYADPVFRVNNEELEAFENEFPYKEKHVTATQLK